MFARLARPSPAAVEAAIARVFPDLAAAQRAALVRAVGRRRVLDRLLNAAAVFCPPLGRLAARFVAVEGGASLAPAGRPLIVVSAHIGPIFVLMCVVRRCLHGRRVILVHAQDDPHFALVLRFVESLGFISAIRGAGSSRKLLRAMRADPEVVVVTAFDSVIQPNRTVAFMGRTVVASSGVAALADLGAADVVPFFWVWGRRRPRVVFEPPLRIARSLPLHQRRAALTAALFAAASARIRAQPAAWNSWGAFPDDAAGG